MPNEVKLSTRARLLWVAVGSVLFLMTTTATAYLGGKHSPPGPASTFQLGLVILAGTALVAAWMSRLYGEDRWRFLGSMTLFGAIPLVGSVFFGDAKDWREFAISSGWLFPWFPLFLASVLTKNRRTCSLSASSTSVFWFLVVGPLLGGIILLLTAILA